MIVIILFPKVHQYSICGYTEWTNTINMFWKTNFWISCLHVF